MLTAPGTGFAVLFEAKVVSDISTGVQFDVLRNQIARTIDVMLEPNAHLRPPLSERRPDRTCFVLITPTYSGGIPRADCTGDCYRPTSKIRLSCNAISRTGSQPN